MTHKTRYVGCPAPYNTASAGKGGACFLVSMFFTTRRHWRLGERPQGIGIFLVPSQGGQDFMIWILYLICPPIAVFFRRGLMPAILTALSYLLFVIGAYVVGFWYLAPKDQKPAPRSPQTSDNQGSAQPSFSIKKAGRWAALVVGVILGILVLDAIIPESEQAREERLALEQRTLEATERGFTDVKDYEEALSLGVNTPEALALERERIAEEARLAAEQERLEEEARELERQQAREQRAEELRLEREAREEERRIRREAELAAQRAEEAEERRKGFHCLSDWDGSHREFARSVIDSLNDAGSFEHVTTRIAPVNSEGIHRVYMDFRAKNGFGALILARATATVSNQTCDPLDWAMLSN